MSRISTVRWLHGGIIAGILVNISESILHVVILKRPWEAARPGAASPGSMIVWAAWGFAYGLLCVWLYAAIRPRFGPGAATAARAGLAAWLLAWFLPSVAAGTLKLLPAALLAVTSLWTLAESLLVTVAGAWIYREE